MRGSWIGVGALCGVSLVVVAGCEERSRKTSHSSENGPQLGSAEKALRKKEPLPEEKEPPPAPAPVPEVRAEEAGCPDGMAEIPGGEFWVGTEREVYDREENPQFKAKLQPFCLDRLEVSTEEYEDCVAKGKCTAQHSGSKTCNSVEKGKEDHPINCVDHEQARAVCAARGARLPTEVEWEYAARGGAEMREYPWGSAHPDDNTCWKHPGTCKRGSYSEEAFGLHDVVGNVWEWTDSWFGRYPWPSPEGRHRVYRGGSWSRRFVKWMRPSLRNRLDPKEAGSHLGVRCAATPLSVQCTGERTKSGACSYEILEVKCLDGNEWNGVRCARPGDDRKCVPPAEEQPGYGCVRPKISGTVKHSLDLSGVTRTRSPQFDADCVANSPGRPVAYHYSGGGHLARNAVGKGQGCKNRDVGVGFNSSCCPN